jgi:hypothetical protein
MIGTGTKHPQNTSPEHYRKPTYSVLTHLEDGIFYNDRRFGLH